MFQQGRNLIFRTLPSRLLLAAVALSLAAMALPARAQDAEAPAGQAGERGQFAGMARTAGELTAIAPNKLTLKTEDGSIMQVVTTDNTRLMKGRGQSVKLADLKVGDGVTAAGNLDAPNKTLHAALVFVVDAEQVKQFKDNLGKTYIAGKVTAIDLDDAKMTVERGDHVSQTISFDETTSFKRGGRVNMGAFGGFGGERGGAAAGTPPPAMSGGESITLADIKVGDTVGGQGSVKNGVFVPTLLTVANPPGAGGQGRRRPGGGAGGPPPPPPPPQR
jgi:predicted RNA-binding protein